MLRHYRIESVIGQGGFGITYGAYDTELHRKVAIKECYPKDFVSRDGTTVVPTSTKEEIDFNWALGKFVDEATTLALFKNTGIVQVLQILKEENNTAYMVLEFVEGQSLHTWLKGLESKPTEEQLKKVIVPLIDALQVVHENGIAHRDIAPDNIYIRNSGDAVLLDFGAARQTISQQSRTMNLVVKDGYSAPEQYYTEGKQGAWTDIYAFAATVYRAIAGKRPIDAMARLDAFNNGDADPLKSLHEIAGESYSDTFLAAVMKGMAPQTKKRPQDLTEWRSLLMDEDDEVKTVAISALASAPASIGIDTDKKKNSFVQISAIALLIASAVLGGGYWYNEQQTLKAEAQAQSELKAQNEAEARAQQEEFARQEKVASAQRDVEEIARREAEEKTAREAEIKAKQKADARAYAEAEIKAWKLANAVDNRYGYTNYLSEYAVSQNAQSAKAALAALSAPWTHLLDDNGAAQRGRAIAANDDFIAVVGEATHKDNAGAQAVVYKFSWSGKLLWKQEFGDAGDEILEDVIILDDGSIIVVGHLSKPSSGLKEAIIRSYNIDGNLNWQKVISTDQSKQFNAVAQLPDGDLVVVGKTRDILNDASDGWLVKFNKFGDFLLEKTLGEGGRNSFADVRPFSNGSLAVIGSTQVEDTEKSKFWLLKLDSKFNVIMNHSPSFGEMSSLEIAGDGQYFAVGNIKLSETSLMSMASRVTRDDKVQPIISTNKMNVVSSSIALTSSNEMFIAGQTSPKGSGQVDGLITKYSADFREVLWERVLGGSGRDTIADVEVLSDGTAVVVGSSEIKKNSGSDFWIMRLGPGGQYKLN